MLGAAGALLAIGVGERLAPGLLEGPRLSWVRGCVCLAGLVGALGGAGEAGFGFAVDGLSQVVLAVLFLTSAAGAAGLAGVSGAVALATLAADGAVLVVAVGVAVVAAVGRSSRVGWGAVGCLVVAVLAAGWHVGALDVRFAVMRGGDMQGALMAGATVGAAVLSWRAMPGGVGGVLGFYLLGRMLLDLAGSGTPGWWGAPVLLVGMAGAAWGARRVGTARDGRALVAAAGVAGQGFAVVGLGVSLLARGSDLPGLEALGAGAALLALVCWALWVGLLAVCLGVVHGAAGSGELSRMGGVLRRAPGTGVATMVALASMGVWPGSAGFVGLWTVLQAVLGAGRLGGTVWLALAGSCLVVLGLAAAWLAAGAVRVGGMVLLGVPRAGKAWVRPGRVVLAGMAGLAIAVVGAGVWPGLMLGFVQPGVRLLSGGEVRGGAWSVAGVGEGPGLVAPVLVALMVASVAGVAWVGRGPVVAAAPWQGGTAGDGVSRENAWQAPSGMPAGWRTWRPRFTPWMGLLALGLVLAAVLGWTAR